MVTKTSASKDEKFNRPSFLERKSPNKPMTIEKSRYVYFTKTNSLY
jgi:hypothetical protein